MDLSLTRSNTPPHIDDHALLRLEISARRLLNFHESRILPLETAPRMSLSQARTFQDDLVCLERVVARILASGRPSKTLDTHGIQQRLSSLQALLKRKCPELLPPPSNPPPGTPVKNPNSTAHFSTPSKPMTPSAINNYFARNQRKSVASPDARTALLRRRQSTKAPNEDDNELASVPNKNEKEDNDSAQDEALQQQEREIQEHLSSELVRLSRILKENSSNVGDLLAKDAHILDDAYLSLQDNVTIITKERIRLQKLTKKSKSTTCLVLSVFLFVTLVFIATFLFMKWWGIRR